VVVAIARYSTSAEEGETVCCFLVFQEMGECPKNTNQPVVKRLVRGQPCLIRITPYMQLEARCLAKKDNFVRSPLRYLTMRSAAFQ